MIRFTAGVLQLLLLATVLVGIAQAAPPPLQIEDGYVREMPPGQPNSAAYMTLRNTTAEPIALVAATCDVADRCALHRDRHTATGMVMTKVTRLEIPAHGERMLRPGGLHLMLIDLKHRLQAGQQVHITLLDERGRAYPATLPVRRLAGVMAH